MPEHTIADVKQASRDMQDKINAIIQEFIKEYNVLPTITTHDTSTLSKYNIYIEIGIKIGHL